MTVTERSVRTVAIIPARGGSKGVPGKNLRTVGGVPLVVRAVSSALCAQHVDAVYVSTDDEVIAAAARQAGADIIRRPAELAGDQASSESALLHGLDQLALGGRQPEILVFLQCTSPFIDPLDLDSAVELIGSGRADSAFSGIATYEFLWRDAATASHPGSGPMVGQNHDAAFRPRRQDRRPDYRETGAFYAMTTAGLRIHRHRFFGHTAVVKVPELTAVEIDSSEDLSLAEALARVIDPQVIDPRVIESASRTPVDVDAVITDFDGVHTPDTAYLDETGRESIRVSRSDGLGIARLRAAGIAMLIVSKERNQVVTARARKLGVEVLQGVDDKAPAVLSWLAARQITPDRAAYLGNDINDLAAMRAVAWPVAVQDARPEVLAAARLTLSRPGGLGAVRELCDLVVEAQQPLVAAADSDAPPTASARTAPKAPGEAVGERARLGNQPV